eukprot:7199606-Karenia_brevis.AAC.1
MGVDAQEQTKTTNNKSSNNKNKKNCEQQTWAKLRPTHTEYHTYRQAYILEDVRTDSTAQYIN